MGGLQQHLLWRPRATRAASTVRGHLRLVHTSLLLRGGARTPLQPLEPESFWRSTLPSPSLLRRLTKGEPQQEGARRPRKEAEEVWGQLTTRGADEAFAVGRRLEAWLAEQGGFADLDTDKDGEDDEDMGQELHTTVITSPSQRAMLTARAVLSALLPRSQRADAANVRLRLATRALRVEATDEAEAEDEHAKQDVALDLAELLGQDPQAFEGATWARLLDVAESAEIFGLLPKGQLTEATWQSVLAPPRKAARTLADAKALDRLAPLLRLSLEPCLRWNRLAKSKAARTEGHERLRLLVLPGFSMLSWAAALDLPGFVQTWPSPASNFLVETLIDEADVVFLRIWRMRDYLELKPKWHKDGPIPLDRFLEELQMLSSGLPREKEQEP